MMNFFDEEFYKELNKNYEDEEEVYEEFDFDEENKIDSTYYAENMELEVNKSNQKKFTDIMDNASSKDNFYWDLNDPIIKFILIILFIIIMVGFIICIVGWFTLK